MISLHMENRRDTRQTVESLLFFTLLESPLSSHGKGAAGLLVRAAVAGRDCEFAGLHHPSAIHPECQIAVFQREGEGPCLSRLQKDPSESFKLLLRPHEG